MSVLRTRAWLTVAVLAAFAQTAGFAADQKAKTRPVPTGAADLGRNEYCRQMIRECGLRDVDFWTPPADGQKAVQRKPLLR